MKLNYIQIILFSFLLLAIGCKKEQPTTKQPTLSMEHPNFDADSAYLFVKKQVDFGPRVPGTTEHKQALRWLQSKLQHFADTVEVQKATAKMYNGKNIPIYNIIGSFNPEQTERILLAAHWDSRHIADKEINEELKKKPILGANDGASGVGVLLEIARQLSLEQTDLGIDIIFFDAEDLGSPVPTSLEGEDWCLGSQYWAKHPHVENYKAKYGILLDMVGADDASFRYEQRAYKNAAPLYNKTWTTAQKLGYGYYFVPELGGSITDDHIFVMIHRQFPMIDIIDYDDSRPNGFGSYHHTHQDNMDVISKNTLRAVGETVLATISN